MGNGFILFLKTGKKHVLRPKKIFFAVENYFCFSLFWHFYKILYCQL